jgi:hypothetical protein
MSEGLDDADVAFEMHSLLLSLAGLIDDELLGWCRELVAVGESDYVLELVTATVQADRLRLPGPLRDELLDTAIRRRVIGRPDNFPAPDPAPRMRHRFTADPTAHGFPAGLEEHSPQHALHLVPPRLLRDCQMWLSWRITPAGGAPGPVPHPIVLIEVSDGAGADVLAYQVAEVLSRAGVFASVEVFASDTELADYHRAALAESHPVNVSDGKEHSSGSAGPGQAGGPRGGVRPSPEPTNGGRRTGVLSSTSDTGGIRPPGPAPQEGPRRPPLHPVDRVITARSSAPRRPRPGPAPDRQQGSLDDVAAGLSFDRAVGAESAEPASPEQPSAPNGEVVADAPPQVDGSAERRPVDRPASGMWNASRDTPAAADTPPVRADGARGSDDHPRPRPRPTNGQPPAAERDRPPSPGPAAGGAAQSQQNRGAQRPADQPDTSSSGLSDVEQRLLRQLHEELAQREDDGMPSPPDGDQPPTRIFRSTNGGRKRPPRPGPDRTN